MNIILRLWWSLASGKPVVPSRWQATHGRVLFQPVRLIRVPRCLGDSCTASRRTTAYEVSRSSGRSPA